MRILLDYRPALREPTGVGEYFHELAAALAAELRPPDVLTLFSSSWKDRLPEPPVRGTRGLDIRVPVRVLNFAWHRLGWPSVELFAGPVDVAHSPHPLLIPSRRAASVVTIHDLDFLDHPKRTRAEIRRDYAALAASHAQRADAVLAVSAFTAGEIVRRLGVRRDRITICSPGAPHWAPRQSAAPAGPILFMGTLEPRKNVGALLGAYTRLLRVRPDAPPLLLAGHLTESAAQLIRAIREPPLAGRVEHLGYVPGDRKYELYARASMLVLPSHLEGFGLPVLEAMTVGVPVIVSRRGALPEVAGDAGTLVEPDDQQAIADAMRTYLDDPQAVARAVERGFARARAYSWEAAAKAAYEAYEAAIARRAKQT